VVDAHASAVGSGRARNNLKVKRETEGVTRTAKGDAIAALNHRSSRPPWKIRPGTDLGANDKTISRIRQGPKTPKPSKSPENRDNQRFADPSPHHKRPPVREMYEAPSQTPASLRHR
jgi:hypothetical protein